MKKHSKPFPRILLTLSASLVLILAGFYLLGLTFQKEIHRDITITASDERAWQILTDFSQYPNWNPYIRRASGDLKSGAQLTVRLQPPGTESTDIQPTIVTLESKRKLCWCGSIPLPGLLDGEHCFTITPLDGNTIRFTQSERFDGILLPFLTSTVEGDTPRGFEAMNQALKTRVEQAT